MCNVLIFGEFRPGSMGDQQQRKAKCKPVSTGLYINLQVPCRIEVPHAGQFGRGLRMCRMQVRREVRIHVAGLPRQRRKGFRVECICLQTNEVGAAAQGGADPFVCSLCRDIAP